MALMVHRMPVPIDGDRPPLSVPTMVMLWLPRSQVAEILPASCATFRPVEKTGSTLKASI